MSKIKKNSSKIFFFEKILYFKNYTLLQFFLNLLITLHIESDWFDLIGKYVSSTHKNFRGLQVKLQNKVAKTVLLGGGACKTFFFSGINEAFSNKFLITGLNLLS